MASRNKTEIYDECIATMLYPDSFRRAGPAAALRQSNGIGPDAWPKFLRRGLERVLPSMVKASFVHDWEFGPEENDGTIERWHEANSRWLENVKRDIRAEYGWWRPLERARSFAGAQAGFFCLESGTGREAWLSAFERNETKRLGRRDDIEEIAGR